MTGLAIPPLTVVVGAGGVGKTTLAAALGVVSAQAGERTLVMTFDPSLRLKDALGVAHAATEEEIVVPGVADGRLSASLLDASRTFDRLVERYAPDAATRQRILSNRFYSHLAGRLGGILEYMAVERLYEIAKAGKYDRVILDTPPTAQAIDFLGAPSRIVDFLDSGALKIALKPWFQRDGRLRIASGLGFVNRGLERFLDRIIGLQLLRDMSEFFRAFEPLFPGFRSRAQEVEQLLASRQTLFALVTGPGEARIPDTLFFIRRLQQDGMHLGPVIVNRMHPEFAAPASNVSQPGLELLAWLGDSHQRAFGELQRRLPAGQSLLSLPLAGHEPTDLEALAEVGNQLVEQWRSAL